MPGADADRQRPEAQLRSRSTCSAAVTATGTTLNAAWVKGTSSRADSRQQDLTSAPVHEVSSGRDWDSGMANWSRKNTPSNRSARANSGGNLEMSFDVPTKKTSEVWSDSQVKTVPN